MFPGAKTPLWEGIRFFKENFALVVHEAKSGLKEGRHVTVG
jgi:hypothetical protein